MDKLCKILISLTLTLLLITVPSFADNGVSRFDDVPQGHWAEKAVHDLRLLKITDGIGSNKYGMGLDIKRCEFVTYLARLMNWETVTPEKGSFIDNMDTSKWYYPYIETAYRNGAIPEGIKEFRPEDPITREEMAIMLVNALGYGYLAQQLSGLGSDFDDVSENTGYITIAKDFGIITGTGDNRFKPYDTAKREEAAVMMMRMYEKIKKPINELHAFYAIRSYPQIDFIPELDSVSFGWSRIEYDSGKGHVVLNTTSGNRNDFYIPPGFEEPFNLAEENNVSTQLMVFADSNTLVDFGGGKLPVTELVLTNPELRKQAVSLIAEQVNNTVMNDIEISFDGVVIDFEGMKGETLKNAFSSFLGELRNELDIAGKKLIVAVHPERKPGQEYYDGYDYKTIGQIADKVILMAHDYYAKRLSDAEMETGYAITPLTPADEIYYALKAITDKENGVENPEKIWLQISFDSVQWSLQSGKVLNREPYKPGYEQIRQRLLAKAKVHYSVVNGNPYIEYIGETDQTRNIIWYEDSRSVMAKVNLAKMFGVNGISLWRLGNIPNYDDLNGEGLYLDIWQNLLKETQR
ncbi:MAG TPA: glycosyl hydrolase family 18 protein [Thermoclostridium sp.]